MACLAACVPTQATADPGPGKTHLVYITDIDANAAVILAPNAGILVVALESDGKSGLQWVVKKNNPNVLDPVGKPTVRKLKDGRLVTTLAFKALNAGADDLVLHYSKPSTKGPFKEFKLHITVGNANLPAKPLKPTK